MNEDRKILYDFPVSYAFRGYEAELNGEDLPPIDLPELDKPRLQPPPPWVNKQWDYVEQLKNRVTHVENKLKELQASIPKRKKEAKY